MILPRFYILTSFNELLVHYKHLPLFLSVCMTVCVSEPAYGCGLPTFPPMVNRVVGGEDVRPHSWPWQASLQYKTSSSYFHTCGGTLISNQWIFSCRHFNYKTQFSPMFCMASYIFICLKHNDIALIKLQTPVQFSDTIKPACLPKDGQVLPNATPCYVTGWGRLWTGGPTPDILQQALLPVVDHQTCSQPDWWGSLVTGKMVCAGGDGLLSSCNGDSGGPLNCQSANGSWDVQGVVSFGSSLGCNYPKKPSVFTRVASYSSWINKVGATTLFILFTFKYTVSCVL
uniref:pancreatic elastase II n=1 Tax=Electrophorus electricus TaxID=8005 RepID=A0A4W4FX82_ELEEL